ncbi:MAG: type II toxin-antitoxin system RelE/ParE family toxin [Rhodospirillaceae bacterium]
MRIVFLKSTLQDVAWFRYYYRSVFPEGEQSAKAQLKATQSLLAANPYIGHPSFTRPGVRELHLQKTPFSLIYRVTETKIEILRLWDERQGSTY